MSKDLIGAYVAFIAAMIPFYIAIWSRKREKQDQRRDAARVVLADIRTAEGTLRALRETKAIHQDIRFLLTNSWQQYKHLFTNILDQDEVVLLESFFTVCEEIQAQINGLKMNRDVALRSKTEALQRELVDLAFREVDEESYEERKQKALKIVHEDGYVFEPAVYSAAILERVSNLQPITSTTAGQKIKKIANVDQTSDAS